MSKKKILSLLLSSSILLNCQVYAETINDVNNINTNIELTTFTAEVLNDGFNNSTETLISTVVNDSTEVVNMTSDVDQLSVEMIDTNSYNINVDEKIDVENSLPKLEPIEAEKIGNVVTELNEKTIVSESILHNLIVQQSNDIKINDEAVQSENLSFDASNNFIDNDGLNVGNANEKLVGTLIQLGSWNGDKPVGKLSYYGQMLPHTSFKTSKIGVIISVVILTGLLINGLYYYSKKVFD